MDYIQPWQIQFLDLTPEDAAILQRFAHYDGWSYWCGECGDHINMLHRMQMGSPLIGWEDR